MTEKTILVVDDTPENIDIISNILRTEHKVCAATNGARALKFVRENKKPDLILLDIMMPEMDGYEVIEQLKGDPDTRDIPVVFLTALADDMNETEGLSLGAVDYITKPVIPEVLIARVNAQLQKSAKPARKPHVESGSDPVIQRLEQARSLIDEALELHSKQRE